MSKDVECVRVAMRCRPLSSTEMSDNRKITVQINTVKNEILVSNPKPDSTESEKTFTFDMVYDWNSSQDQIYKQTACPIVESVLEGFNGTIFAYGQTGTGKTFTMEGKPEPPESRGIIPRAFKQIFEIIEQTSKNRQFLVRCSFLELYNEEIRDLLSKNVKNKLDIRENKDQGVFVKDLTAFMAHDMTDLLAKLQIGRENRVTGETKMNRDSSRSHSLFTVTVEMSEVQEGQNKIRVGKLNLVDLAGSERQSKTQATGDRFKEAININQSLTTLGNVISALVDPKASHIPYRDSKLTRLLQDSLGGNTKTVMIANIGPADYNYDETLSTLRYANRAKNIKNKPRINEDPKDAMIRQFQEEIEKLKKQLADSAGGDLGDGVAGDGVGGVKKVEKVIKIFDEKRLKELQEKTHKEKEEIRLKAEKERQEIENVKMKNEEEKKKLLDKLKEKEEEQQKALDAKDKLLKQIQKMEKKVVRGSAIIEKVALKEKELNEARKKLEDKKELDEKYTEKLKETEDLIVDIDKKYNSQKEEIEDKTKKIKVLWNKLKSIEAENKELDEFYLSEINSLQERRRLLQKEMKLKQMIVEYFIPEKELRKLEVRAAYNENIDDWTLPNLELAGNLRKPNQENVDKKDEFNNGEYEEFNILDIENHPNVYFAYNEDGLIREEELAPREKKNKPKRGNSARKKGSAKNEMRVESAKKNNTPNTKEKAAPVEDNFPKAKGLVPKR